MARTRRAAALLLLSACGAFGQGGQSTFAISGGGGGSSAPAIILNATSVAGDAYTATPSPAITSYTGLAGYITFNVTEEGSSSLDIPTINVSGLGDVALLFPYGASGYGVTQLQGVSIVPNIPYPFVMVPAGAPPNFGSGGMLLGKPWGGMDTITTSITDLTYALGTMNDQIDNNVIYSTQGESCSFALTGIGSINYLDCAAVTMVLDGTTGLTGLTGVSGFHVSVNETSSEAIGGFSAGMFELENSGSAAASLQDTLDVVSYNTGSSTTQFQEGIYIRNGVGGTANIANEQAAVKVDQFINGPGASANQFFGIDSGLDIEAFSTLGLAVAVVGGATVHAGVNMTAGFDVFDTGIDVEATASAAFVNGYASNLGGASTTVTSVAGFLVASQGLVGTTHNWGFGVAQSPNGTDAWDYHAPGQQFLGEGISAAAVTSVSGCGASLGTGATNIGGTITGVTTVGACTIALTFAGTAAHGISCSLSDATTGNLMRQTSFTTQTATFQGITASGDTLIYAGCSMF